MSAVAHAAPLPARSARREAGAHERLALRVALFWALASFAAATYGELLIHPPVLRLLGVTATVTVACAALSLQGRDGRPLWRPAPLLVLPPLVALAAGALAVGVPAHLLAPAHWPALGRRVSSGVDGLGAWLWPYRGGARWSRIAVLLVVPATVTVAGTLCFWPSARGRLQRWLAGLALLVALFLVGAANTPGREPGLRGLVLLALIGGWLWLPRAAEATASRAARWLLLPALLALALRPALSSSGAWLPFREAVSGQGPVASFQWDQVYGPIDWSRSDAPMFTVEAAEPGLLRVTSLDRFDGLRFLRSASPPGSAQADAPRARDRAWVAHATIVLAGLRSPLLVGSAAGSASVRWFAGARAVSREADGTLVASSTPSAGFYRVTYYRPRPSVAELRRAPRTYPRAYLPYTQLELPAPAASGLLAPRFAAEARAAPSRVVGPQAPGQALSAESAANLEQSVYAPALQLARRLAAGASDSYDIALSVERYLLTNYTYDEQVPAARYPLEAFLFETHRGYCQQFSGAMTLLLRMDGIPARVAAGFKPAIYDRVSGLWTVRAVDAHSWVEVFFAGIGWVPFDPTPATPVALSGSASSPTQNKTEIAAGAAAARSARLPGVQARGRAGGSGWEPAAALLLAAVVLLAGSAAWLRGHLRLRRALRGEGAGTVEELARVLGRVGGMPAGITLARLERELEDGGRARAARYVGALRAARYGAGSRQPERGGRAALRLALLMQAPWRRRARLFAEMPPGAIRGNRGRVSQDVS